MKKILLITLFDERNIGNRLQNYALQKILEKYDSIVITINNFYTQETSISTKIKYIIKKLLALFGQKKYSEDCQKYDRLNLLRKSIQKFNYTNISNIKQISNKQVFEADWSGYDLAIAGSDQVWHRWRDDENELPYYYLQFVPQEKRVAYAASFGFEAFPEKDIEQHRVGLQGMNKISCREEVGCRLVEELTGKRALRVLDPTLLLSAEEWREIENKSNGVAKKQDKYAFIFFLGNISDKYREYMSETMKKRKIDKLIDFNDKKLGECGPCEFLSLIDNAQFVFTDSFHCVVFSTIFDKDFTVFRREQPGFENMFGRIEDLLSSRNKLGCIYGGTEKIPTNNFGELYKDSIQYLESVLGIENEDR